MIVYIVSYVAWVAAAGIYGPILFAPRLKRWKRRKRLFVILSILGTPLLGIAALKGVHRCCLNSIRRREKQLADEHGWTPPWQTKPASPAPAPVDHYTNPYGVQIRPRHKPPKKPLLAVLDATSEVLMGHPDALQACPRCGGPLTTQLIRGNINRHVLSFHVFTSCAQGLHRVETTGRVYLRPGGTASIMEVAAAQLNTIFARHWQEVAAGKPTRPRNPYIPKERNMNKYEAYNNYG